MEESRSAYLSSSQAVNALGIKPTTLYAYVSRGLLQSVPDINGKRRLYRRSDVERLRLRAEARTGHGAAAAGAMHYGAPILSSQITELTTEGPRYRGLLACEIAMTCSFEQVADLLWVGNHGEADRRPWPKPPPVPAAVHALGQHLWRLHGHEALLRIFSIYTLSCSLACASTDPLEAPRSIIGILAGCLGYLSRDARYRQVRPGESIAQAVLAGCGLSDSPEHLRVLNALLIALADDELASATFVARVAASSNTELYACLVAAIESSSGWAREYRRVENMLTGATSRSDIRTEVESWRDSGQIPPGFSSELSRGHDPRTALFLELAQSSLKPIPLSSALTDFLSKDAPKLGLFAKPVLGLEVLAKAMNFPRGALPGLFVLARSAGWVAHVMEQQAAGINLRPRAKFTGSP